MGLLVCSGCSTLGLSTNPVAHLLTGSTQEVLNATRATPMVPRELSKTVTAVHFLQAGDELLIESMDVESDVYLPADQRVQTDGSVDLGKYGRMVVAGMTLEQAESSIQEMISPIEKKAIPVNVRLVQPVHRYYVIGEVNSPGAYSLIGHETVLDAIMEAGGLTAKASACDLLLARPTEPCDCRVALPVCYRAITQLGDTTTNYHLKPGDRIFVGRQTLMEEIRSYCSSTMTCDRCCSKQVACCDPNAINQHNPAFVASGTQAIPAPRPPSIHQAAVPPDASSDSDRPEASLEMIESNETIGIQGRTEPSSAVPNVLDGRLDGELDFESFLRQDRTQ